MKSGFKRVTLLALVAVMVSLLMMSQEVGAKRKEINNDDNMIGHTRQSFEFFVSQLKRIGLTKTLD
jgi:hypothetical protein